MKSESLITFLLALLAGYLVYLIAAPFFVPVFWAGVFAIVFHPYYQWLKRRIFTGRYGASVASAVACATIALFLIVPVVIMASAAASELFHLYQWADVYIKGISNRVHDNPAFTPSYLMQIITRYSGLELKDLQNIFASGIKEFASFAASGVTGFIKGSLEFVVNAVLAFFTMFYMFKDGERLLEAIKRILPLSAVNQAKIIKRSSAAISASVNGGVLVGALQGLLGGGAFWALGLTAPVLWGIVMLILSFLPGIGCALVWLPAAAYLLITGAYVKGIALIVWGTLVIGLVDNLLRPIIVGGKINMHPLFLFFGILGAVSAFGIIGIIAGPLIVSVALVAIEIYQEARHE